MSGKPEGPVTSQQFKEFKEAYFTKVDAVITNLGNIAGALIGLQFRPATEVESTTSPKKAWTADSLAAAIPEDLRKLVVFSSVGDIIKVQVREFQRDKKVWDRINNTIEALGGRWVGGIGKESHWAVPKQ